MGSQAKMASRRPWSVDLQCCITDHQLSGREISIKRILLGLLPPQNIRKSEHKIDVISYNGKKNPYMEFLSPWLIGCCRSPTITVSRQRARESGHCPISMNRWQRIPEDWLIFSLCCSPREAGSNASCTDRTDEHARKSEGFRWFLM